MGLFDFLRKNLLAKRRQLEMRERLLSNLKIQMIALQDGKPSMQNLIVFILISPILGIMERLSNICFVVQIRLMASVFMMREIFGILLAMVCRSYTQKKARTLNTVVMGLN